MNFGRLTDLINNVKKLNQQKIFVEVISSQGVQAFIISLNTVDQIFIDGVQSDGSDITSTNNTEGVYSDTTINSPYFKGKRNPFTIQRFADIDENGFVQTENVSKRVSVGDPYVLFETGSYLKSYRVVVDSGGFEITSRDDIHSGTGLSSMIGEYGNELLGLTNESKNKLAQEILPMVIRETKRILLS